MGTVARKKIGVKILFALYCLFVFAVLFVGRKGSNTRFESFGTYIREAFNIIPFKTIAECVSHIVGGEYFERKWAIRNIFGNFVLFYPMGIFLPCFFPDTGTCSQTVRISFCTILSVELIQMMFRIGFFDIDDVILNMTGWLLGFFTFSLVSHRSFRNRKCYSEENAIITECEDGIWQSN